MPKAFVGFIVVSPETPGRGEPVLAEVPAIFLTAQETAANLVELPPEIDGESVVKGMIVHGFGQIFAKTAADVNPKELRILKAKTPETKHKRQSSWD